MVEREDRIIGRGVAGEQTRTSAAEVRKRYGIPKEVLDRLEEIEVLSPNTHGYSPADVQIIEAIGRFRAGGYEQEIGLTVYDTLRYKTAMDALVKEVAEMLEAGAEPLKDLIAAMHTKLLVAELERRRSG